MDQNVLDDDKVRQRLSSLVKRVGGPLLALDVSTKRGSIALVTNACVVGDERHLDAMAMPSESLVASLANLLNHHRCLPCELKGIVVGLGPGSYTGLRVGLATAKGLALGTGVQLYGISSLLLEAQAHGIGRVLVVRNALRGDVYAAMYDVAVDASVEVLLADRLASLNELSTWVVQGPKPLHVVGDAADLVCEVLPWLKKSMPQYPTRAILGLIALSERLCIGQADHLAELVPTYLRAGLTSSPAAAAR